MKKGKKMILWIIGILTLVIMTFLLYYNKAYEEAVNIANKMDIVDKNYYFHGDSKVGFIIFSGAKADEKSYAYMAELLHKEGHTVVIPKVLFHLSSTGINRGLEIMESNPEIEKWIIIGHSLGGLPASRIAAKQPDNLVGIALLASYMSVDLSELDISALRITAANDEIMNKKMMKKNLDYLPKKSLSVVLKGANHQGFGAYNSLSRDGEAEISWKEQQEKTVRLILDFFEEQINEIL